MVGCAATGGRLRFEYLPAPWVAGDPAFPADWVEGWVAGGHTGGRARVAALIELQARLSPYGVSGAAIIGERWLVTELDLPRLWTVGPWTPPSAPDAALCAVGAGDVASDWLLQVVDAFLAVPDQHPPSQGPCVYLTDGGLLFDPSFMGRRDALVLLRMQPRAEDAVRALVTHRAAWWLVLLATSAVRADAEWTRWEALVAQAVGGVAAPWSRPTDRPVNPQEVTLGVASVAEAWVQWTARALEVASVGVFMADPDDEYVFCLAAEGSARYAYDAGIVRNKPPIDGAGFGLTAAWTVAPSWDPRGRPVLVRDLPTRDALRARLRDVGFEAEQVAADGPGRGAYLAEAYTDPARLDAVRAGPFVYATQQLPRRLSPSGRNLLLRLMGRTPPRSVLTDAERTQTGRGRRERIALITRRIHDDVVRTFSEGLVLWRDGLRSDLLHEVAAGYDPSAWCRTLAAGTSARAVSIWTLSGTELLLSGWSLPVAVPALRTAPQEHLESRELRLLSAPSYPRRDEISDEGFLGWQPFEAALGGPAENIATVPMVRARRPVGLLRIDGAMSLFAGHLPRRSAQGALHQHRPMVLPVHLRDVLEELAQIIALVQPEPAVPGTFDWPRFVREVVAGAIDPEEARRRLEDLYQRAPTRNAAAALLDVHRNSFRRQLAQLEAVLGQTPWG